MAHLLPGIAVAYGKEIKARVRRALEKARQSKTSGKIPKETKDHIRPMIREVREQFFLAKKLSALDEATQYDELVSTYAAYTSMHIQDDRLGSAGILEESQTSALFGLLASSFWHASILDDFTAARIAKSSGTGTRSKRVWVYQDRKQESEYGFDFGIVTYLPADEEKVGRQKVKITIFQAKRPASETKMGEISISHRVRGQTGLSLPEGEVGLHEDLKEAKAEYYAFPSEKEAGFDQKEFEKVKNDFLRLQNIKREWAKHETPCEQLGALGYFRDALCSRELSVVVNHMNDNRELAKLAKLATRRGKGSLFYKTYSYLQSEALLALAIMGWTHQGRDKECLDWCHYVQWVNGQSGKSWSASLKTVLKNKGCPPKPHTAFSETLAAALSPSDRSIGLVLPVEDAKSFASILLDYSPNLTWGVSADSRDVAYELLHHFYLPNPATTLDQEAHVDTVEQQPLKSKPEAGTSASTFQR